MFWLYMLMSIGIIFSGFMSFLPTPYFQIVPPVFRYLFVIIGFIIANVGYVIVWGRLHKTGAKWLVNPPRRGEHIWFYVHRDGSILITPGVRKVESQLYSPELDAQIQEFKSYRLFDHSVRFVPEGIGHAVDLNMCLYATMSKGKYGFEKLQDARETASIMEKLNPIAGRPEEIPPVEGVITERVMKKAYKLAEDGAV